MAGCISVFLYICTVYGQSVLVLKHTPYEKLLIACLSFHIAKRLFVVINKQYRAVCCSFNLRTLFRAAVIVFFTAVCTKFQNIIST